MTTTAQAMERVTFYGSRLRLARMRRGFSVAELEARTGIDRGRIHRYQADRQAPPDADVEAIAKATGFPVGFFFMGDAPLIDPNSVHFCGRYAR